MRQQYAQLRIGTTERLPTDLPQPLSIGQRVIAIHPETREVNDGKVLGLEHDSCEVQFDRPELVVELVRVITLFNILAFQFIHLLFTLEVTQTIAGY